MAFIQEQIDALIDRLEQLTSRERTLVLIGSFAGLILFVYILSLWIGGNLDSMDARNISLEQRLEEINRIQGQYDQAQNRVRELKRRIANNSVDLVRFVSTKGQEFSVTIDSMNFITPEESGSSKNKEVDEKSVRIEIKKVPLANLAKFLDALENSGSIVKVRRLRMAPNFSAPEQIDVSATISTYSLKQ